jgi:maleate isomerase
VRLSAVDGQEGVVTSYRVGMVVPSSNVTMETEVPQLIQRQEQVTADRFTFHSSRVRMKHVRFDELAAMNAQGGDAAARLADAACDVIAYACLVAAMAEGKGGHERVEASLRAAVESEGRDIPVVSSAGALIDALHWLGAARVVLIAPYVEPLTAAVTSYLGTAGIEVVDSVSLGVPDNLEVAALDQSRLPELAKALDRSRCDAIILSACVQMPSLSAVDQVEGELGLPVVTAATATTWKILKALGVSPQVGQAGRLLAASVPARF